MTATAEKPELSASWPRFVFHADGVRNIQATSEGHFDKLMSEGVWYETPQEPPPPEQPPLTMEEQVAVNQSELEGLGEQVDAIVQQMSAIEMRLAGNQSPDFGPLAERIKTLEASRKGSSGVTESFRDQLAAANAEIVALKEALVNSEAAYSQVLVRIEVLENRKER